MILVLLEKNEQFDLITINVPLFKKLRDIIFLGGGVEKIIGLGG
jgi:hypothetical protein